MNNERENIDIEEDSSSFGNNVLPYSKEYKDSTVIQNNEENTSSDERYNEIFENSKHRSRIWSVLSLVFAIASIACCFIGWVGLALSAAAVIFAVISRKSLGYFDGIAMAGLIAGIFGAVFSGVVIVVGLLGEAGIFVK